MRIRLASCITFAAAALAGLEIQSAAAQTTAPVPPRARTGPTYTFVLNAFTVGKTRAAKIDPDYVAASVSVAGRPPTSVSAAGNAESGIYVLNLAMPNIVVGPGDVVDLSYGIFSSSASADAVAKAVKQAVSDAAQQTAAAGVDIAKALTGKSDASIRSTVGSAAKAWLSGKVGTVDLTGCDGVVAAGDHMYSGAQLAAQTSADGAISITDPNPGTGTAAACGGKSMYSVTWTIVAD